MEQQSLIAETNGLPSPVKERGAVLFLALIALVSMTIAALALVRAVDTANVISGNFAFKQSTLQMADVGIEAAITALPAIIATSHDTAYPAGCTTACQYYPTIAYEDDTKGRPIRVEISSVIYSIDWNAVPVATAAPISGYSVQYVIDRLCQTTPVTNIVDECQSIEKPGFSSNTADAPSPPAYSFYYRVTVRAAGPRGTESYVQSVLSR